MAVSFVMSVCPHEIARFPRDEFSWNLILKDFSKICGENSSLIKKWQEEGGPCAFMVRSFWILLRTRNVLDRSCTENQTTQSVSNNFFPPKIVPFMREFLRVICNSGYANALRCYVVRTLPVLRVCVYLYVCMYVCMYVCVYIYSFGSQGCIMPPPTLLNYNV